MLVSLGTLVKMSETMVVQKQGIVTILGSTQDGASATSLRRTLSADMSSKKWLSQNGFSPMKKTASSEELTHSLTQVSEDNNSGEMKQDRFQIWDTIQKKELQNEEKTGGK